MRGEFANRLACGLECLALLNLAPVIPLRAGIFAELAVYLMPTVSDEHPVTAFLTRFPSDRH